MNGFATTESDLDVTCFNSLEGWCSASTDAGTARSWLGLVLRPCIEQQGNFEVKEFVANATVPILKLTFIDSAQRRLEVDVSCNNKDPLSNTRLLRAYSLLDPAVKDLCIAIKLWARASGVIDASLRNLSSYAFNLLVIYFLQVEPKVCLPCLPIEPFQVRGTILDLPLCATADWRSPFPTTELLIRFFKFYAHQFSWGSEVVSLRFGTRLSRDDRKFEALRGRWAYRLHIEDPYKWDRNLHCVLGKREELKLRFSFVAAVGQLQAKTATLPMGLQPVRSLEPPPTPEGLHGSRTRVGASRGSSAPPSRPLFASLPPPRPPLTGVCGHSRKASHRRRCRDRRRDAQSQNLHDAKTSRGKAPDPRPDAAVRLRATQDSGRPGKTLAPGALYIETRPVRPVLSRRLGKMGPRTVAAC